MRCNRTTLRLSQLPQPTDGAAETNQVYEHIWQVELDTPANGCCRRCGNGPRAASDDLLARVALPDTDSLAFYGVLHNTTVKCLSLL